MCDGMGCVCAFRPVSVHVRNVHHSEMALLHKLFTSERCNSFASDGERTRRFSHSHFVSCCFLQISFESSKWMGGGGGGEVVCYAVLFKNEYVDVNCISMTVCMHVRQMAYGIRRLRRAGEMEEAR
jgi:hypothetical protein